MRAATFRQRGAHGYVLARCSARVAGRSCCAALAFGRAVRRCSRPAATLTPAARAKRTRTTAATRCARGPTWTCRQHRSALRSSRGSRMRYYADWTCESARARLAVGPARPRARVQQRRAHRRPEQRRLPRRRRVGEGVARRARSGDRPRRRAARAPGSRARPAGTSMRACNPARRRMLGATPDARGVVADGWGDAQGNAADAARNATRARRATSCSPISTRKAHGCLRMQSSYCA